MMVANRMYNEVATIELNLRDFAVGLLDKSEVLS